MSDTTILSNSGRDRILVISSKVCKLANIEVFLVNSEVLLFEIYNLITSVNSMSFDLIWFAIDKAYRLNTLFPDDLLLVVAPIAVLPL